MNGTCDAEDAAAKGRPRLPAVFLEEEVDVSGVECLENVDIIFHQIVCANGTQAEEPESKEWSEHEAHFAGSEPLYAE